MQLEHVMIYLFLSSLLVIFFLFTLYNVPVILAGTRNLLKSRERGRKKPSDAKDADGEGVVFEEAVVSEGEGLPLVSILLPFKSNRVLCGRDPRGVAAAALYY